MRLLALDVGRKRIGVAVSDPMAITVRPHGTVERDKNAISKLAQLIQELQVGKIIVGLPLHLDGTESEQGKDVRTFADNLSNVAPNVPLEFWDERLTSVEAEERMSELKINWKERREKRDSFAASILLESYLKGR